MIKIGDKFRIGPNGSNNASLGWNPGDRVFTAIDVDCDRVGFRYGHFWFVYKEDVIKLDGVKIKTITKTI